MNKLILKTPVNFKMLAIAVIAILHFVGFFGLQSSYKESFAALTPLNLLIAFLLLLPFQEGGYKKLFSFFAVAFSIGMLVEIIGVHTGFPFGTYTYTQLLSLQLFKVPILIGINWFILAYGIVSLLNKYLMRLNYWLKCILAALIMTGMDFLIEPFAIEHMLWIWESTSVPLANYLAWFVISFVLFAFGFKIYEKAVNLVAMSTVLIFIIFFGLNFLLA